MTRTRRRTQTAPITGPDVTAMYYTADETAALLRYSAETVRKMARGNQIPGARQVGRPWLIPIAWVREQVEGAADCPSGAPTCP